MTTRKRVLPSGWYPASASECKHDIDDLIRGFQPPEGTWRGGVAPHAGWYFSGLAAAKVIKTLSSSGPVDRVVVYGGHLPGPGDPIVYTEDAWETPFGEHPMDSIFARDLVAANEAVEAPSRFADNTVEVQLPFVSHFFPDVPLIAIHSPASDRAVKLGEVIASVLVTKGMSAVFIGSADLTHYGPNYGFSPQGEGNVAVEWVKNQNDRSVIDKALEMDASGVIADARAKHNTCSSGPIASVIASCAKHGISKGNLVEYYTSYDVMPGTSFVGYAAIVY
jgi:AmmeMemoRadiSam system protein B